MVIVIILLVLAIMFTAGMALPAVLTGMGLTYGSLFLIGIAALAICFIISPEGAAEGLGKAISGVSSAVSGVIGGVADVVESGVSAAVDGLGLGKLILFGVTGYIGYRIITSEDDKNDNKD